MKMNTLKHKAHVFTYKNTLKIKTRDFPGGPVVKNLPSKAGDMGSIPSRGTKIPHAVGQLSPHASTREPACCKLQSPRALESVRHNERENPHVTTREKTVRYS